MSEDRAMLRSRSGAYYTVAKIIENITLIDANYTEMSSRCIQYYNSINMDQIVNDIINVK